jgi:putative glutamine amidotransferase
LSTKKRTVLVLGYTGYAEPFRALFPKIVGTSLQYPPAKLKGRPSLLLFTGGEDISPALYGETSPYQGARLSLRCQWEMAWYLWALKNNIPMFGTCRGVQFFTAMNHGRLIQHVDNHLGGHPVTLTQEDRSFRVNSIHHQMCVPDPEHSVLLAYATNVAPRRQLPDPAPSYLMHEDVFMEPEAIWFPKVRALGVQWHPEGMSDDSEANKWVLSRMEEYLV